MAMPNDLIFIRHGQSEANIVQRAEKDGRKHLKADQINERPDWEQRLSANGIKQALQAKEWIDAHLGGAASFDFHYFSPFLRTRETAAYIGGPECERWIIEDRVVERSWGLFGAISRAERATVFAMTTNMYGRSPWYTKLEGGESRYEVSHRFRDFLGTLHREASGKRVLVVTHGDLMGIARYNIERMLPEQFEKMNEDSSQTMGNCAILHYSRVNPLEPQNVRDKLWWRRMIAPDLEG